MNNQKPYIVGISGGSASGKTYLLRNILSRYPASQLTHISQDNYYRNIEDLPKDENGWVNFDHPNAVNLDELVSDLHKLIDGKDVRMMEYTFNNPKIIPKELLFRPAPIIILEGLFVFYKPEISELLDLKIFVDADEHIKLTRRIRRDFSERGYDLDEVLTRYETHVIPMFRKYIEPYKWDADLIIHNNANITKSVEVILDHLDRIIR